MPYIIDAAGASIDAVGDTEEEAWEALSEAVGLPVEELWESENLTARPATDQLVRYVRLHGGSAKVVSWEVRDGVAGLDLDRHPESREQKQRCLMMDDLRWETVKRVADRRDGVTSASHLLRELVDEHLE